MEWYQKTASASKNTAKHENVNTKKKEANNEENAKQKYYASFTLRGPKHDPLDVKKNNTSATNEAQTNINAQNSLQQNNNANLVQQGNANTSFVMRHLLKQRKIKQLKIKQLKHHLY